MIATSPEISVGRRAQRVGDHRARRVAAARSRCPLDAAAMRAAAAICRAIAVARRLAARAVGTICAPSFHHTMQSCAAKPSATARNVSVAAPVRSTSEVAISPRARARSKSARRRLGMRDRRRAPRPRPARAARPPRRRSPPHRRRARRSCASPTIQRGAARRGGRPEIRRDRRRRPGRPSTSSGGASPSIATSSTSACSAAAARSSISRPDGSSTPRRFAGTSHMIARATCDRVGRSRAVFEAARRYNRRHGPAPGLDPRDHVDRGRASHAGPNELIGVLEVRADGRPAASRSPSALASTAAATSGWPARPGTARTRSRPAGGASCSIRRARRSPCATARAATRCLPPTSRASGRRSNRCASRPPHHARALDDATAVFPVALTTGSDAAMPGSARILVFTRR